MVTHLPEAAEQSGSREIGAAVRALGGLALALALAAGIGAWQLGRDDGTAIGNPRAASMPAPAPAQRVGGRASEVAATYYLVASEAQAAEVEAALDEANAAREQLGESTRAHRVVPLDNREAEAEFRRGLDEANSILASRGLAPLRAVDLRSAPAAAARGDALVRELEALTAESLGVIGGR